jgi:hypothetical protein
MPHTRRGTINQTQVASRATFLEIAQLGSIAGGHFGGLNAGFGLYENSTFSKSMSSSDAPPVKRIHAIYGINMQTEVGGIYKHKDCCLSAEKLKNLYTPDAKATIDSKTGYVVKSGILMETPKTKQKIADDQEVCGDGTVLNWSLQHCKTWKSVEREIPVLELDKAEHREILADSRFHKALLEYCRRSNAS